MAEGFAAAGAHVIINGTNAERVASAVADFNANGHQASASVFDVTSEEAIKKAFADFDSEGVDIDILVNNAGIQFRKPMVDLETTRLAEGD